MSSTIMKPLKMKQNKVTHARKIMNSQMVEKSWLEMKDSEPLKSFSHQRKLEAALIHLRVSISTVMTLYRNVMLMSEKIFSKISSSVVVQLYSKEWEKECGKKSINWPQQLIKSKFLLHQKGNSQFG